MTAAEVLLLLILLGILFFVLYYFLKGSTGRIAMTRPIESRIDEYLDQRFEDMITEWSLTTRSKLRRFDRTKSPILRDDETKVAELKQFEESMKVTLDNLEERLDVLEKELAEKGKGKGKEEGKSRTRRKT
jgi:small nuclear ribonucleoprotein (snRNP)-like protein